MGVVGAEARSRARDRTNSSGRVEIVIRGARFTEADAEAHIHGICFKTGPPERVGVELEWLVRDRRDPARPVQAEQVAATLAQFGGPGGWGGRAVPPGSGESQGVVRPGPAQLLRGQHDSSGASKVPGDARNAVRHNGISLSSGSSLTVEPGGQLEI